MLYSLLVALKCGVVSTSLVCQIAQRLPMVMYNDHMESLSVTEFKAHCLEILNRVAETGESILLTKRGKPTAMVGPAPRDESRRWIPGQFRDRGKIVGDIIAPYDEHWEANS